MRSARWPELEAHARLGLPGPRHRHQARREAYETLLTERNGAVGGARRIPHSRRQPRAELREVLSGGASPSRAVGVHVATHRLTDDELRLLMRFPEVRAALARGRLRNEGSGYGREGLHGALCAARRRRASSRLEHDLPPPLRTRTGRGRGLRSAGDLQDLLRGGSSTRG